MIFSLNFLFIYTSLQSVINFKTFYAIKIVQIARIKITFQGIKFDHRINDYYGKTVHLLICLASFARTYHFVYPIVSI